MMRIWIPIVVVGCAGSAAPKPPQGASPSGEPEEVFGPLEVGADYATYTKLTDKPFLSLDHGNRWVDVYVNQVGLAAYDSSAPIPPGTVVVKASVLDDGGRPGTVAGPIYVMHKREAGYAPDDDDWWYALHWAAPSGEQTQPIYWRGKSPRVDYCTDCHSSYDRSLGGLIPSSILKR